MLKILLWPFALVWWAVGLAFGLLGFVLSLALGIVFIVLGTVCVFTIVGALLGMPLIAIGLLLFVRAFCR